MMPSVNNALLQKREHALPWLFLLAKEMGRHRREIQLEAPSTSRPRPSSQLGPLKSLHANLNEQTININSFLRNAYLMHSGATQAERKIDIRQ